MGRQASGRVTGGVTAPQESQPSGPSHTHASREALADRLQPSGASQSSNGLTDGMSQADASPLASAATRPLGPSISSGDMAGGSAKAQSVGRVGVESLGGLAWQLEGSDAEVEKQIYVAVFQLKAMIRDSRCAAMVSFPAGMPIQQSLNILMFILDAPHEYMPVNSLET